MTNAELEVKVKELLEIENYFDLVVAAQEFEKEYKTSDFYRATKMPLEVAIKGAKLHYGLKLDGLFKALQQGINNFDFTQFNKTLDQISEIFQNENSEIQKLATTLKDFNDTNLS